MFLGQAGMFLSFQARRSSATRSSTSDLTVWKLDGSVLLINEVCKLDGSVLLLNDLRRNMLLMIGQPSVKTHRT